MNDDSAVYVSTKNRRDAQQTKKDETAYQREDESLKRLTDPNGWQPNSGTEPKETFTKRLVDLSNESDRELIKFSTFFPFDFFPDKITISPLKIDIKYGKFFASRVENAILVKDIESVSVETSPFLATLCIIKATERNQPITIKPLKKSVAEEARKIIQGLIIARSESSDISRVETIR